MQKIVIEQMKHDDIEDVLEVERSSFTIPWSYDSFAREIKQNGIAVYLVAKVEKKVVGYIGIWKVLDEGHITNMAVHPLYRNLGIGQKLLEGIISLCEGEEIYSFTLEVRRSNLVALRLYKKLGFEEKGIRIGYYSDNNEDAIIMWRLRY